MNNKKSLLLSLFILLKRIGIVSSRRRASRRGSEIRNNLKIVNHRRKAQELAKQYNENAICLTMEPPTNLAPSNSNCFEYYNPNDPTKNINKRKGCDYKPCENAVCSCDSYCCDIAWDISCRGYMQELPSKKEGNKNNDYHIINGCSAKLLCCEQDQNDDYNDIMNILPMLKDAPNRSIDDNNIDFDYLLDDDVVLDEKCINNNNTKNNHCNVTKSLKRSFHGLIHIDAKH